MKNVRPSAVYAMDGYTAIRHVITVLGGAQAPLTAEEMARSYKHSPINDFGRIIKHERVPDEAAAKVWLVEHALTQLGADQIAEVGENRYRLKVSLDDVRIDGKPVAPLIEEKPQFAGGSRPFDPMSGLFSDNIRAKSEDDDLTGLRESMRARGWNRWFPAIRDERGVVLVGHRRIKVAKELGIKPVILDVTIGSGEAADAERLDIAILSNIEQKKLSPASRRRIAEYLYGEREWSMQKIGQALRVSQQQISKDLTREPYNSVVTLTSPNQPIRRDYLGRPSPKRGEGLAHVLKILAEHPEGVTRKEWAVFADREVSGITKHALQLETASLAEKVGRRPANPDSLGTLPTVWRITEAGKARLENLATEPLVPPRPKKHKPPPAEHVHKCPHCGLDIGGGEP